MRAHSRASKGEARPPTREHRLETADNDNKGESGKYTRLRGANLRNMVAGIVNTKIVAGDNSDVPLLNDSYISSLKKVYFVPYTVFEPKMKPSEGLNWLKLIGFKITNYELIDLNRLNLDQLSSALNKRRNESEFEIDGLVVCADRFHAVETGKNPSNAFAFKNTTSQNLAETVGTGVEWNLSKDGFLKPVVKIGEVSLGGVKIRRVTGFNPRVSNPRFGETRPSRAAKPGPKAKHGGSANYIAKNQIGTGTKLLITRSGDVIPQIVRVLKSTYPNMPNVSYVWNKKEIFVREDSHELRVKKLQNFFNKMKINEVSSKTVEKMYNYGFHKPQDILYAPLESCKSILGANGTKIYENLVHKRQHLNFLDVMDASNAFTPGFSKSKLSSIFERFPNVRKKRPSVEELTSINGISATTAQNFLNGLDAFEHFLQLNPQLACE